MWESKDANSMQDSPSLVTVPQLWFAVDREELWMQDEATYYFGTDRESVVPIDAARAYRTFDREVLWIQDEATYYFSKVLQNLPGYLSTLVVKARNQDPRNQDYKNILYDLLERISLLHKESTELRISVVIPRDVSMLLQCIPPVHSRHSLSIWFPSRFHTRIFTGQFVI